MRLPAAFSLFFLLAGCGPAKNDKEADPTIRYIGTSRVETISGSPTYNQGGGVRGTGALRFYEALSSPSHSFTVHAELEEGEGVTLVTHAGASLENGVELELYRPAGSTALALRALATGGTVLNLSSYLSGVSGRGPIRLTFDVHNAENGGPHLVVFNDAASGTRVVSTRLTGLGYGMRWGFRLNGGNVSFAGRGAQRASD